MRYVTDSNMLCTSSLLLDEWHVLNREARDLASLKIGILLSYSLGMNQAPRHDGFTSQP
jgi:hypothetical protein